MPFPKIKLSSGGVLPGMAFGVGSRWRTTNVNDGSIDPEVVEAVKAAIGAGFRSFDAAENYYNEDSLGAGLKAANLPRSDLFIKTKVFTSSRDIPASIKLQLERLGLDYVDMYLVHTPKIFAQPGGLKIIDVWREMEKLVDQGLVKSIGVSNFTVEHFEAFWDQARIKPSINQIPVYPYRYAAIKDTIEYCKAKDIVVEAYEVSSSLIRPTEKGGPLDAVLEKIVAELKESGQTATEGQVLLQWASHHGCAVVSTSSKPSRMKEYIAAGDVVLSDAQVKAIDDAGKAGADAGLGVYNTWNGHDIKV